ncbi:MAG TPA: O-antigen ligase family protein [Patescibacteria group bacterium]|nr:O-antigen ligase family protein [Patescibacteria group bacterium]
MKNLEKACLWLVYLAIGLSLTTPLFMGNGFFFPFITTKVLWFRILVEVMVLAYLVLLALSDAYRPRLNKTTIIFTLFVAWVVLSSALGHSWNISFWGNIERGEGLMLWLHGWAFFVVLASVVRSEKAWKGLFDISLGIAVLISLFAAGQALGLGVLLNTSGSRADATFGNAAFLAAYILFHIAFATYLFMARASKPLRIYYGGLFALFVWVLVATETRGAILGFAAGLATVAALYIWINRGNRRVMRLGLGAIVGLLVVGGGLFLSRNQPWIQNSAKLRRIVNVSFSETTAQTRVATWKAAWKGWTESPRNFIFGVGLENFGDVFDKYFPPTIYQDAGSQVWFDRAHNLIFDRGTTTGIVGLLLYLAFLFYPVYASLKRASQNSVQRHASIVFAGLAVAFLIQDLFVFESITTYAILFFTWAYYASILAASDSERTVAVPRLTGIAMAVIYAAAFIPILWYVNLLPASANRAAAVAGHSNPQEDDFFTVVDRYKRSIEPDTYGRQEYRVQFIDFVGQQLANAGEVIGQVKPVLAYTDEQADEQLMEYPDKTKNYLVAMRHYNYTFAADPKTKIERLNKALSYFPKLQVLSPTRPLIWQEAGYSELYLYRNLVQSNPEEAAKHLENSENYFKKALDLNPAVVESYLNMLMLYANAKQDGKFEPYAAQMRQDAPRYQRLDYLYQFYNMAKNNTSIEWINYFTGEIIQQDPEDINAWIDRALSFAYLGNRKEALAAAERIKSFGGDYIVQADKFIENVNSGYYEKNKPN